MSIVELDQEALAVDESGAIDFVPVRKSLADMLGREYTDAACRARAFLTDTDVPPLADEVVDFFPQTLQSRLVDLLAQVGNTVLDAPLANTAVGAGSASFAKATKTASAPLSGLGYYRLGEAGRLHLVSKSEHYHTPLGHAFPGYGLLERARALGIINATHNNTRGFITRRLEEELVRTANGLARDDADGLTEVLARDDDLYTLNRVLNLQTGSLAAEAALKLVLARFIQMQPDMPEPTYSDRVPVVLVMGNDDGELQANYHGTPMLTQMLRGMWPGLHNTLEEAKVWKVVAIRPNNTDDLDRAFETYEQDGYKIAGFFHEIVMMNYGGRLLTRAFLQHAYALCKEHDVPTVVDEIQSCLWAPQLYMFREYGLTPSCLAIGKGFSGGEYAASRLIFSSVLDVMPQFGALVTNGQEELAALAYLVTMEWAQANADVTAELGAMLETRLRELADDFPGIITGVDGWRHMTTLAFAEMGPAKAFVAALNRRGLDISVQTYKAETPPVALLKLPLIADRAMIEHVVSAMQAALGERA
jgi:acetylornithine/succinyldiaminopimelate/putrescine aminotransferase